MSLSFFKCNQIIDSHPLLDSTHFTIADEVVEGDLNAGLKDNNLEQNWAIRTALKRKFKLIQGGSGKYFVKNWRTLLLLILSYN